MSKTIIINSEQDKTYCHSFINQMPLDGTEEIIFKKVSQDSTAKQNRLRWLWNSEAANSGLGKHDTKEKVHLAAKWQFVRPILLRDDETGIFTAIYEFFMDKVKSADDRSEHIMEFTDRYIRTGDLTRQQGAESLTDFQNYWTRLGVNLTDPSLQGCDLDKMARG